MRCFFYVLLVFCLTISSSVFASGTKITSHPPRAGILPAQLTDLDRLNTESGNTARITWNSQCGTPVFISGNLRRLQDNTPASVYTFLTDYKNLFRFDNPLNELSVISNETDEVGMTHIKFQQMYNGLPVVNRQLIAHIRRDKTLSSISGGAVQTPKISTMPLVSGQSAKTTAENDILRRNKTAGALKTTLSLCIYAEGTEAVLAWEVAVHSISGKRVGEMIYVDAADGQIIRRIPKIYADGPVVGDGIGVKDSLRVLQTYQFGSQYQLIDASRAMYREPIDSLHGVIETMNQDTIEWWPTVYIDPDSDNHWNNDSMMRAAVDAHYNIGRSYDFYQNAFNRNSFDNLGSSIFSWIHAPFYEGNAAWDEFDHAILVGDGDSSFLPCSGSFEIMTHELTHGVTAATSNLVYLDQSGALDESFSDLMGITADSNSWLYGDDIVLQPPFGTRSISSPWNSDPQQPYRMDYYFDLPDSLDCGGVHYNSGIPSWAYYNFATMQPSRMFVSQIWYRANTLYLTPMSQFTDLRDACVQSCIDLHGNGALDMTLWNLNRSFDQTLIISNWGDNGAGYFDGFELNGTGWTIVNGGTNTSGTTWDTTSDYHDSGKYSMICRAGEVGETQDEWLISPPFTDPALTPVTIRVSERFINASAANDAHYYKIGINSLNTSGYQTVMTENTSFLHQRDTTWMIHQTTVTGTQPGYNFYLAFEYRGTHADSWVIDEVTLFYPTGVQTPAESTIPLSPVLYDAYPNPFNATTKLRYFLPKSQHVQVVIVNMLGQEVTRVADGVQSSGMHEATVGRGLASGVYFVKLVTAGSVQTKKIALVK